MKNLLIGLTILASALAFANDKYFGPANSNSDPYAHISESEVREIFLNALKNSTGATFSEKCSVASVDSNKGQNSESHLIRMQYPYKLALFYVKYMQGYNHESQVVHFPNQPQESWGLKDGWETPSHELIRYNSSVDRLGLRYRDNGVLVTLYDMDGGSAGIYDFFIDENNKVAAFVNRTVMSEEDMRERLIDTYHDSSNYLRIKCDYQSP